MWYNNVKMEKISKTGCRFMVCIPKNKLLKFGISIGCNRKRIFHQTGAGKWIQNNFCEGVCSQKSLTNIENGRITRFVETYEMLAERLGLKMTYNPELEAYIDSYTKEIYKAIEYYNFDDMRKYFDKLYELLDSVKDCLWYCDLYNAALMIDGYYSNRKFVIASDREYYADMITEFSNEWDEMLKAIIYISAYHDMDTGEYKARFEEFEIDKCQSAFNKVNTMLYLYDQDRTKKLLILSQHLEAEWLEKKNDLRLLDLYGIILPSFSFHDVYEVEEVYNTIMDILDTHDVSDYKRAECYNGIGVAFFNLDLYEESIANMLIAYENDKTHTLPLYVYIAHAQRRLRQKVTLPYYSEKDIKSHSLIYQKLYKYYTDVVESDLDTITKYILNQLVPLMNSCKDKCIFDVMDKEVELIANTNNYYKLILQYQEKVILPEQLNKEKIYFRRIAKK